MSKVKQKQRKRRAELIEAAIPIITRTSFADIGITEICRELGISSGSFYHYFSKKSDLLIGLLWLIDEDLEENVFSLLTCEDEIENLKRFAHYWAAHVNANGIERSILISTINPESDDFPEHERPAMIKLREIISAGQAKGQITTDYEVNTLAYLFLMTLRSVTLDWSRRGGSYPIVEQMDQYISIFVRAFRP